MTTKVGGKQCRGLTTGIPERSPAPLHYAVVRPGEKELEVLRIRLEGKGEVLPVFSAAWASRGYLFAEAPGGGWYVSTYTPGELISLLVGPCVGVEWVALDCHHDLKECSTEMLPSVYLDLPEQETAKEFACARNRALLRRIGAFLRRHRISNRLLSFDEVTEELGPWRQAYLGSRTVPVESIVGSEGRYADFDDEFLPLRGSSEEKWKAIYFALRSTEGLPPVSLLKVGDTYFVHDGNHRVSVARWLGVEALYAEVAELRVAVPIETAISARDLPERKSRWHLRPSVRPSYGPPAADSERSDRPAHARRGEGDRACP